jgi:hypothetical protein
VGLSCFEEAERNGKKKFQLAKELRKSDPNRETEENAVERRLDFLPDEVVSTSVVQLSPAVSSPCCKNT